MNLTLVLQLFFYVVATLAVATLIRWLLNQPSDGLLILAALVIVLYIWISFKTICFTKNPFTK